MKRFSSPQEWNSRLPPTADGELLEVDPSLGANDRRCLRASRDQNCEDQARRLWTDPEEGRMTPVPDSRVRCGQPEFFFSDCVGSVQCNYRTAVGDR